MKNNTVYIQLKAKDLQKIHGGFAPWYWHWNPWKSENMWKLSDKLDQDLADLPKPKPANQTPQSPTRIGSFRSPNWDANGH